MDLPWVARAALRTTAPDGRTVRLPPPAVPTPFLEAAEGVLPFAPAYGEHTDAVLGEIGLDRASIGSLRRRGIVA